MDVGGVGDECDLGVPIGCWGDESGVDGRVRGSASENEGERDLRSAPVRLETGGEGVKDDNEPLNGCVALWSGSEGDAGRVEPPIRMVCGLVFDKYSSGSSSPLSMLSSASCQEYRCFPLLRPLLLSSWSESPSSEAFPVPALGASSLVGDVSHVSTSEEGSGISNALCEKEES